MCLKIAKSGVLNPCFCQTPVLGLGLGVDFTFTLDNNKNNHNNNLHLNFLKGTVLGDKEQGVGIRDKGYRKRDKRKGSEEFDTEDQVLFFIFLE